MLDLDLFGILGIPVRGILEDWMPYFEGARAPRFRVDPPDLKKTYDAACEALRRKPTNIQALFTRGVLCRTIGWYPEALADFAKVIRLEPKHARAWLYFSEVLANLGEHEKSDTARKKALELDPDLK
jgi:tetratricopeptide (TPR) repeat protein